MIRMFVKMVFKIKKQFVWKRAYNSNKSCFAQAEISFDCLEIKRKLRFFIKKWHDDYIVEGSFKQDNKFILAEFILDSITKAEVIHKEIGKIFGSGNAEMIEYVAKN